MVFSGFGILLIGGLFSGYGLADAPATQQINTGFDYLLPTKDDRQLRTSNAHVFLREKSVIQDRVKLRLGVGVSRVTGSITQLRGEWGQGTLHSETLDSAAWGAGPEVEASWRVASVGRVSAHLDLLGGVFLYDRDFPAGGRRYNGSMQTGVHAEYAISPEQSLALGYRWMHTSNGHGTVPSNPGYEGAGLSLRYAVRF